MAGPVRELFPDDDLTPQSDVTSGGELLQIRKKLEFSDKFTALLLNYSA